MRRTQISLTEGQLETLRGESERTGLSIAQLIRQAVDQEYGPLPAPERLGQLRRAFGGWRSRRETGAEFVERVRSGTERRLTSNN
jgi:Ribbon-helix-helix protein, copG family